MKATLHTVLLAATSPVALAAAVSRELPIQTILVAALIGDAE